VSADRRFTTSFCRYLLLQQAVGEDDLDDRLDGVLTGPVALQLDREGDPADGLPAGLDLETATVARLRALLDAGHISSEHLTRAYIDRIRALGVQPPSLNAVRALNPAALEEARAADAALRRRGAARPPLLGIPVLVKDNIDVRGMPTTAVGPVADVITPTFIWACAANTVVAAPNAA